MPVSEIIFGESVVVRPLPININRLDLNLFEHELEKNIPATILRSLNNVTINSEGLLFRGSRILVESFPSPESTGNWVGIKGRAKAFLKYGLKKHRAVVDDSVWVTDTLSRTYFHWLTDALPRLFVVRDRLQELTLLLPSSYKTEKYIVSSLSPFPLKNIEFVDEVVLCKNLKIPTHTAPTGNYNEHIIRGLRDFYTEFYQKTSIGNQFNKIYISRGKTGKRMLSNEMDCVEVLEEFGFKTIYFEDYSFEQQVEIVLNTRYLVSNHGSGLTNMLFMKPESQILELRQKGDSLNNCFFSLASALGLKYSYQLCDSQNPGEDAHTANLFVDCRLLRENIGNMLCSTELNPAA
jgi:Glycosyltransferase 61